MRRFVLAVLTAAAGFLGGCSGGEADDQSVPLPPSNATDVRFLQGLLVLDERAQRLAQLAEGRLSSKEVTGLAEAVRTERGSESALVRNLLRFIGSTPEDVSEGPDEAAGGPGDADLAAFEAMSGPAAEQFFLELLIKADEAALGLADAEISGGLFADAKTLAGTVRSGRESEIATARRLLGGG